MKTRSAHRYVTVNTDVDDDELAEFGLHRADSCAGDPHGAAASLHSALNALHQQAHPDQPLFVDTCLREPCRSLLLRQFPDLGRAPR